MSNNILGVDIGHRSMKVALVSNGQVVKTASANIPESPLFAGAQEQDEQLADALRGLLKREKIRAAGAALCISSEHVLLQSMDLPPMREEEVKQNLVFEFRNQIEDAPETYIYDYMSVNPPEELAEIGSNRMYLIGAAVPDEFIEEMRHILQRAGVPLLTAAPELAAYKSLILRNGTQDGEFCFVDIGNAGTQIYLFHGESYVTSQELGFGLKHIEGRIMEELGVSQEAAQSFMLSGRKGCMELESVKQELEQFSTELRQRLEYYRMSSLGSRLSDVWLLGGGAALRPLVAALTRTLDHFRIRPASRFLPELNSLGAAGLMFLKAAGIAMHL